MNDLDDTELRALLADPATARPDAAFTAQVLRRWGARQRWVRRLVRLLLALGAMGPLIALAPQTLRSLRGLQVGSAGLGLALAAVLVLLALGLARIRPSNRSPGGN